MKTIKMCGILIHYPYEPYPQQISIAQAVTRACTRLQNGAVEIPTGCGKTLALLCSALGFQVEQRYKLLEAMNNDDTMWEKTRVEDEMQFATLNNGHPTFADVAGSVPPASPGVTAPSAPLEEGAPCNGCACSHAKRTRSTDCVVLDDDDDDFVALPGRTSKPTPKKARLECGGGSCCAAPCDTAASAAFSAPGHTAPAMHAAPLCTRPLKEIEDTTAPAGEQPTSSSVRPGESATQDFHVAKTFPPWKPTEVVDLVSSEDSDDPEDTQSTQYTQSSQSTQFTEATQEFLSQAAYEEDGAGDAGPSYRVPISREAVRATLRGRMREPTPGGEYGPTRQFALPRGRAPVRVPKIYYASRTHLQLGQVASEIRRTHYCDARVVVLSSREHTCINDRTYKYGSYTSRTEMCHELLNSIPTDMNWSKIQNMRHMNEMASKSSCIFHRNSKSFMNHDSLIPLNVGPVIDLNTLVAAGRSYKFCPYFVAHNLMSSADIILCPVNYLIDPIIRKSMNMELKGNIVIIDEAHMLDDLCRESGSLIVSITDLKECLKNCHFLTDREELPHAHGAMVVFLEALVVWIETNSKKAFSFGYNKEKEFSLPSAQLIASLQESNIIQSSVTNFVEGLKEASSHKSEILMDSHNPESFLKAITSKTETICERLALIMELLFQNPADYVGSITLTDKFNSEASRSQKKQDWALKLMCQNAGLIFNTLSSVTRSIIFSSATLSPLSSFAAELGVQVQNNAVRGHVIPPTQTWIGCLGRGRNGHELYGRYSNTKSVEYMDAIGNTVLDICCRVPYGILVFVTAYWTLENIVQRWKDTNLWAKIGEHKRPLQETRYARDFKEVLNQFDIAVAEAQVALETNFVTVGNGCTGPLLIAVMRGKVSEGFNFADNKTRAIITVGIPYPNFNDDTVRWKREYNKLHALKKPIQDAEGWYNTQAFTALSQSLGRGLRHRKDWCVLLLLDARLQQLKYSQLLPLWMHERMINYHQYAGMLNSIEEYVKRMEPVSDDS